MRTSRNMCTGIILLAVVSGFSTGLSTGGEFMESSESGPTVRVMVRKEFELQRDGSYKEIPSDDKNVNFVNSPEMENDHEESESAPPPMYAYSPYPHYGEGYDVEPQGSAQYLQLTADDVQDVMRQLQAAEQKPAQLSPYSFASFLQTNETGSESAPAPVRLAYPEFVINRAPARSYFVERSQGIEAPNSIQEIITKPDEKHVAASETQENSHYYSPKDQYSINYNYDTTGPSSAGGYNSFDQGPSTTYGGPTGQSGYTSPGPSYGTPAVSDYGVPDAGHVNQWSGSYGDVKHGDGGDVVNSLVHTVAGIGQTKAHQVSSILSTKGEVGSQILNQGGKVVQQAVHQKAEKAKIIASTLSQVPARFSQVLRTKANIATGFLDHGSRALGSVLNVKAQVANQASHLISAKGKAANAVIRASGGTAADLIVAKGKGIATLISSGGAATAALLNHKGNKVAKIAEVLGGFGGQGYGWSSGGDTGLVGGYSENKEKYQPHPSRVYDERKLQDALKFVVQSPSSSYGSPPGASSSAEDEGGQAKITSAFKSLYNTFKSVQPTQSLFGSYSSSVEVTAKPAEQPQPSFGQSASSIGESLNKMSNMLNNVATQLNWLNPKQDKAA